MGLPTTALFASHGHRVLGVDTDSDKVSKLQRREYYLGENSGVTRWDHISTVKSLNNDLFHARFVTTTRLSLFTNWTIVSGALKTYGR
jgi:UDP-N-acetyl-D-mannosaminuronate dehydrogenase